MIRASRVAVGRITKILLPGWRGRYRIEGHDDASSVVTVSKTRQFAGERLFLIELTGGMIQLISVATKGVTPRPLGLASSELLVVICAPRRMIGTLHLDNQTRIPPGDIKQRRIK